MTVRSILEHNGRDVVVIAPADTLSHAVAMLNQHKIGALVVVDREDRPTGALNMHDLLRAGVM